MATAEELLRLGPKDGNVDKKFYIDFDTRAIKIPPSVTQLGVESDDDVKDITFSVPRYYYGKDLKDFQIYINYLNAQKEGDLFEVFSDKVREVDDNLEFDWTVGRHAVAFKGKVIFNVCMKKIPRDAEGNALRDEEDNVIVEKEFNTTIAELPVLEGLETGEEIAEDYIDILMQWEEALFGLENSLKSRVEEKGEEVKLDVVAAAEAAVEAELEEQLTRIEAKTSAALNTIETTSTAEQTFIRSLSQSMIQNAENEIQNTTDELIDDILNNEFCGTVEITDKDPVKKSTVLTISPSEEEVNVYTAEEVDEMVEGLQQDIDQKLIGKADKELIVTVTGSESVGYTADKTSVEISAAWENGCDVRVISASNNMVFIPHSIVDTGCIFVNIDGYSSNKYGEELDLLRLSISPSGAVLIEEFYSPIVPTVTTSDNDKVLTVVDGKWTASDDNSIKSISLNGVEQDVDDNGNVALTFEIDPSEFDVDLTGYIKETDVVNNLTSDATNKPLSAAQGKVLKDNVTKLSGVRTPIIADSSNGKAYTVTVPGVTELINGLNLLVVPTYKNTIQTPTLNMNGLGDFPIYRYGSNGTFEILRLGSSNSIDVDTPVILTLCYYGEGEGYWLMDVQTKPSATDLSGIVPIENGGTGVSTIEEAKALFGGGESIGGVAPVAITIPAGRMRGDINGDGLIDVADRVLVGSSTYYNKQLSVLYPNGDIPLDFLAADVDGNGAINGVDLSNLLQGDPSPGTWAAELTGNWINNPNAQNEEYQFYTDIEVDGIHEDTLIGLIVSGPLTEENYFIQNLEGKIRLFVKLCPVEALNAFVIFSDKLTENIVVGGHTNPNNFICSNNINEELVYSPLNFVDTAIYFTSSKSADAYGGITLYKNRTKYNLEINATDQINLISDAGVISASSGQVKDLADPTDAQDAATKNYVDTAIASIPTPTFSATDDGNGNVTLTLG